MTEMSVLCDSCGADLAEAGEYDRVECVEAGWRVLLCQGCSIEVRELLAKRGLVVDGRTGEVVPQSREKAE